MRPADTGRPCCLAHTHGLLQLLFLNGGSLRPGRGGVVAAADSGARLMAVFLRVNIRPIHPRRAFPGYEKTKTNTDTRVCV